MHTVQVSSSEAALKGSYVRSMLERRLTDQIRYTLSRKGFTNFTIERSQARIIIDGVDPQEASKALSRVFGAASIIPCLRTTTDFEDITQKALQIARDTIQDDESFAVRAKAIGEHPYSSNELAVRIGSDVLRSMSQNGVHVNLDRPDRVIYVEARDHSGFVYTEVIHGPGGYPYGSQGRLVSLFSGGIDSPVATWMMMKRGADVVPVFFDQRPYVGEEYRERALEAAKILSDYVPLSSFSLYVADLSSVMEKILSSRKPGLRCILCKRSMYRLASQIAHKLGARGLITGESMGQVASQTLDNLAVLSEASKLPVYRPLIAFDKVEIEAVSKRIGTYAVTARRVEGCSVVPKRPKTRSNLEDIKKLEDELDLAVLEPRIADQLERVKFSA